MTMLFIFPSHCPGTLAHVDGNRAKPTQAHTLVMLTLCVTYTRLHRHTPATPCVHLAQRKAQTSTHLKPSPSEPEITSATVIPQKPEKSPEKWPHPDTE